MTVKRFPSYNKVKITVLRKLFHKDLVLKYTNTGTAEPCSHFQEGQEFINCARKPTSLLVG